MTTSVTPAKRTVSVLARHTAKCLTKKDLFYRRCNCRKSLYVYEAGKAGFISARTRSWETAQKLAGAGVVQTQLDRRRAFLETGFARNQQILPDVRQEVGQRHHEAAWMLELAVAQIETELQWLTKVNRELPGQPPGTRPAYDLHRTKNKSNVE